ncbi:MAG: ribosomal protein S18-alanine N-acetyltransferase [Bacilli bacterium]|nr:ribosomal protein S18-alanine N-acetyltransferase [Bacilli bacterium]
MSDDVKVVKVEDVRDFNEIMEIEEKAFAYPYPIDLFIFDFEHHPYSEYYKLMLDDQIIGYCGLWIIFEDVQITTIAVHPDYQGKGYGDKMMEFIINYVKELGCRNITLEVRVSNNKAINFYKKHQFEIVGLRKQYYENGEDAYLMKRDL